MKIAKENPNKILVQQEKEKQYEYILDDEIEFVQALKMPGSKGSEAAKEPSEFEKKKMSIEETKRSLPVFPFKQDLIEAVREHQVSVPKIAVLTIN
jgi:pre-mRNA-splicing factor ATP-dependent RNA helicase DHX16